MNIGKKYKIDTDPNNFILKSVTTKTRKPDEDDDDFENREPGWVIEGYFYDFRELLKFMADNEMKGVGLSDLKAVSKKQDEIYKLISSLKLLIPAQYLTILTKGASTGL